MSFGYSHRFSVDALGRPVHLAAEAMAAAARAYFGRNHAEAERLCQALIERDPLHFEALHLLGVVCLDRSQLSDAVGYLTRAARERPDDAQVHYHLGTALLGAVISIQRGAVLPLEAATSKFTNQCCVPSFQ